MKKIVKLDLTSIDDFKNHPFLVEEDDSLKELTTSIKENGLLEPLKVRKKEGDRYEMISGHRRKKSLLSLGIKEAECTIEDVTDEEAVIQMVDSNLHRERILQS